MTVEHTPVPTDLNEATRHIWDENAVMWDERMGDTGNDFQRLLIAPASERLLNLHAGERVLEIACGNGVFARRMAELGVSVLATDFSASLLELAHARTRNHADRIEYRLLDATREDQIVALGKHAFDAAVCNMAIMDMAEIDPLMRGIRQVVKPGGRFLFSLGHPCFNHAGMAHCAEESTIDGERVTTLSVRVTTYLHQGVLQMMKRGIIEGVIVMEIRAKDPRIAIMKEQGYPFVMIGHGPDNSPENDGTSFVDMDMAAALRTSVEHLAGLGHQEVAFLNIGPAMSRGAAYAITSTQGFEQSITRLGLRGKIYPCPPDPQKGYELVRNILEERPTLTGIITINSWVVGSIVRAVQERGLRIPDDISVVTMLPAHLAEWMHPAMTSIDFPYQELGRLAAEMLIRQLDEPHTLPTQTLLQVPLTIRQSTGPYKPRT